MPVGIYPRPRIYGGYARPIEARTNVGAGSKRTWANHTPEERLQRLENISIGNKRAWEVLKNKSLNYASDIVDLCFNEHLTLEEVSLKLHIPLWLVSTCLKELNIAKNGYVGAPKVKKIRKKGYKGRFLGDRLQASIKSIELWNNFEYREKQRLSSIISSPKRSLLAKLRWAKPGFKDKVHDKIARATLKANHSRPNKPESILLEIITNNSFPFEYNGSGKIFIGGKNPDFINLADKEIIELFGVYWHSEKITGRNRSAEEQTRINHFEKFEYSTLIIWEDELEDIDNVSSKIRRFTQN